VAKAEDPHIAQEQIKRDRIQGENGKGYKEIEIIEVDQMWKDGQKNDDHTPEDPII
jgi:hypothetical protein